MSIEIRTMDIDDCAVLGEIHSESWKAAYRGIVPESFLCGMTADASAQRFRQTFIQGDGTVALAVVDGQTVGFICLGDSRDDDAGEGCGEIWGIYLLPTCWRRGTGTSLLEWGIQHLQNNGCNIVTLWVLEDNVQARSFYEKMGFVRDGAEKHLYLGRSLTALRYRKEIR